METKEVRRRRLKIRIWEMVNQEMGASFHNIKAVDGNDVTFINAGGDIQIFIEHDNMKAGEEIEVTWKYLSDAALEEIVGIIHDSN